jgi:hypothetical protein
MGLNGLMGLIRLMRLNGLMGLIDKFCDENPGCFQAAKLQKVFRKLYVGVSDTLCEKCTFSYANSKNYPKILEKEE